MKYTTDCITPEEAIFQSLHRQPKNFDDLERELFPGISRFEIEKVVARMLKSGLVGVQEKRFFIQSSVAPEFGIAMKAKSRAKTIKKHPKQMEFDYDRH